MDRFDWTRHGSDELTADLAWVLGSFVLFGVVDALLARLGWFSADRNGRYLTLHVLCNFYVTAVHFDDVLASYADVGAAYLAPSCDTRGVAVVYALHIYHIVSSRFRLPLVDWVHHVVMVVVMLPLAWVLQPGPLLGHGAFFASGLPGGLDYVMLVAVKKGWLASLEEKRLNAAIMVWLRAPGCLYHAHMCWLVLLDVAQRHAAGVAPLLPRSALHFTRDFASGRPCLVPGLGPPGHGP